MIRGGPSGTRSFDDAASTAETTHLSPQMCSGYTVLRIIYFRPSFEKPDTARTRADERSARNGRGGKGRRQCHVFGVEVISCSTGGGRETEDGRGTGVRFGARRERSRGRLKICQPPPKRATVRRVRRGQWSRVVFVLVRAALGQHGRWWTELDVARPGGWLMPENLPRTHSDLTETGTAGIDDASTPRNVEG